jgi:hypothetical protein
LPAAFFIAAIKLARTNAVVRRRRRGAGECPAVDTVRPRPVGDSTRRALDPG